MTATMPNIELVQFSNLYNWSVQYLLEDTFSYNQDFPLVAIGAFLKRNKTTIEVKNGTKYKRVTIKTNNGGVFLRDIEVGEKIGTKNQFTIKEGQFLVSKIDARNGAFGVVTNEVDGAIITGNFWAFDVDYSLINPHYLALITTTPEFIKFCENSSTGTTNRHYLQEDLFLAVEIPLPPLDDEDAKKRNLPNIVTQEKLVAAYNQKIAEAEAAKIKAKQKEVEIDTYLLEELEIKTVTKNEQEKGLRIVKFSSLEDKWFMEQNSNDILSLMRNAKYPIKKLGESFELINRSWKKPSNKDESFKYVEIGGIEPNSGIVSHRDLIVKKAPSRATQIIKEGDFILGTTRPYLKKFAIVPSYYDNSICSSGFAIFYPNKEKYNLEYLKEILMSIIGTEQFKNKMTGALYPAITNSELKQIQIPFPDINIQNRIVNKLIDIREEITSLKQESLNIQQKALLDFENQIFKRN